MSTETNKEIVRRYRAIHNSNNLDGLDAIVASDLISHNSLPGLPAGLEGGKMAHHAFLESFPDAQTKTEDLIAEGDKVAERYLFTGTNAGPFMGAPATGRKVQIESMSIYRIANGKIVEHWGENDTMGLMTQLGEAPM